MSVIEFPSDIKFTVRGYRCFSDKNPLEFYLSPGFTAFIGPNNSGKSTILKFFYEFRDLWKNCSKSDSFTRLLGSTNNLTVISPIINTNSIFSNADLTKQISITIEIINIGDITIVLSPSVGVEGRMNVESVNINNNSILWQRNTQAITPASFPPAILNVFSLMSNSVYIPACRIIIDAVPPEGKQQYFDIALAKAFVEEWGKYKTGTNDPLKRNIANKVVQDIKDIFQFNSLEINPSYNRDTLIIDFDGHSHTLHDIGIGIAHFIITFATVALRNNKPSMVFIDEPELNLHATLQRKLLMKLAEYSEHGSIIFATHSLGLAKSTANRIYSVIGTDASSYKHPKVTLVDDNEPSNAELFAELTFSEYQELGVNKILFVEGVNDIRTMQQFLRKAGIEHKFCILSLGGSALINGKRAQELGEIKKLASKGRSPEVYCLIDSEKSSSDATLSIERQEFSTKCHDAGYSVYVTDRRSLEHYISAKAVNARITHRSAIMPGHFDKFDEEKHWKKDGTWLIAKEMELEELSDTGLGEFIQKLKEESNN